jgi:DNA modification methylase
LSAFTLIPGDCLKILPTLPGESAHCVCTSPPYFRLRNYQGGDGEVGQEKTPQEYVSNLVKIFREVRRVLRKDGCVFLNLGDTYGKNKSLTGIPWRTAFALMDDGWVLRQRMNWFKRNGLPSGSAYDRPGGHTEEVFLFSNQGDYFFDLDAVKKVSADPEFDRRRRDSIGGDKFANSDTKVRNDSGGTYKGDGSRNYRNTDLWFESIQAPHGLVGVDDELVGLDVLVGGYGGSHYAAFPCKLVRPLIKMGTSEKGCCPRCLSPWVRVRERVGGGTKATKVPKVDRTCGHMHFVSSTIYDPYQYETVGWEPSCTCHGRFEKRVVQVEKPVSVEGTAREAEVPRRDRTAGNRNGITGSLDNLPRQTELVEKEVSVYVPNIPLEQHPVIPCTVLDPFGGVMTVGLESVRLNRDFLGIELSAKYLEIGRKRIQRRGSGHHGDDEAAEKKRRPGRTLC